MSFADIKNSLHVQDDRLTLLNNLVELPSVAEALSHVFGSDRVELSAANVDAGEHVITITGSMELLGGQEAAATILIGEDEQGEITYSFTADQPIFSVPEAIRITLEGAQLKIASASGGDVEGGLTQGTLRCLSLEIPAEAPLPEADGVWKLSISGQPLDLSSPAQVAQLVGLDNLGDSLPDDLAGLPSVPLNELTIEFTRAKLHGISATVGLLEEWAIVPDALALKDVQLFAQETEPETPGETRKVQLLLSGTVAIGPIEVPISPKNEQGGKKLEITLGSETGVSLNDLAGLLDFAGVPDLSDSLPAGLAQLGGITLTEMDITIDYAARKLEHAAFTLQSVGPWALPDPNPFAVTDLEFHIDLTDPFERATRKIGGSLKGTALIHNIPVTISAEFGETLVFNGTLPDLTLSTLAAEWLGGTSLPQELQEVTFQSLAVTLEPKKKSFSFSGKASASWTLPFGDGQPETSELELHFLRDPVLGNKCLLALAHSGDLPVSGEVTFHDIALGFDYKGRDDWSVVGSLKATAFDTTVDMQIGMKTEEGVRTYLFKGILVMFPASLAGVASLNIFGLEVNASKSLSEPNAQYDWSVSLAGVLEIEGVATIDGKALVEKKGAATAFAFSSKDTHVNIPLGIPEQDVNLVLQLNSISIQRARPTAPWTFDADVAAGLTGLPGDIQKYLPAQLQAIFAINENGSSITVPELLPRVSFDVPDATVSGVGFMMGTTALELVNFTFKKLKGQRPAFTVDLGIGLPAHLNDTFGVQEDGTPRTWIFNTYDPDDEDTITRLTVGVNSDRQLVFQPATLPFGRGGEVEPTYTFDFDDFGQLSIDVPSLIFDGKSISASGGFRQTDPENHPLKIPLTPLKALLTAMTLELVARTLPDGIPLKDIALVDNRGSFVIDDLADQLRNVFGSELPDDVTSALEIISSGLDRLPDAFKNYFHAVIPDGFHFALGFNSQGNIHIQLDVETPEGRPQQAIKFLTFGLDGVLPAINGVQLYSLSLDSVAGNALQLLRLDAIFEQFDIISLAASLVIPDSPVLPDPSRFVKRWSIRDLYMLLVLEVGDAIPIPLFFSDLGVEFYNFLGLGGGLKVQFPIPTAGLGDFAALADPFKRFVTEADYLLPGDLFAQHNLALNLGMNPAYLQLPPYLGGKVLGSQGQVFQVDLSEPIVGVLNCLKKPNLGKLAQMIVTILPLQYRMGAGSYSLAGILDVQAAFLLTTPDEFVKLTPPPVEATLDNLPVVWSPTTQGMILFLGGAASIGSLASLKAMFGLALTEAGFSTRVHIQGEFSHLLLADLQGDMRITTKQVENAPRQTAFELNGHSRIYIFDHLFLRGDLQMDDNHLFMDGAIQVFPDASPLQIGGAGRLWIDREGNVSLNAGVAVSLLNFDLVGATLDVLRNSVEEHFRVTATWLGVQALFEMGDVADGHGGRTYQMTGSVNFPAPGKPPLGLNLDSGPIYFPGTSLKLCDNIHISTSVTAGLAVTLSNRGFSAGVYASFTWNNSTWSVDFHIAVSFASLEELVQRIAQAIIDQVYELFKKLWSDATAWLMNVGNGIVDIATQQIGPALAIGWNLTAQEALAALKEAKSTAEAVGSALTEGYHLLKDQAAQLMKEAGYLARDAAAALEKGYQVLADEAGQLLKMVGYSFTEIAGALTAAYHLTAAQLASALKAAEYTVEQIASGVRVVFNLAQQGVYRALKTAGFALDEVQKGVQKAFNLTQRELAILIAGIGATASEAGRKIQAVYHLTYTALADALREAGYTAQEVAGALKDVGKMARDALAAVMTEAGYFAQDVALSIKNLYNETAAGVTAALHAAGAAVRDVAIGVQAAFNLAARFLAQVMKDAQYTAQAVAQGLKAAFNSAETAVAAILKDVGYVFNDVANSVKQVFYLGEAGLAAALRAAGYAADQVAAGVKMIFNSALSGLTAALKFAGYAASEVAIGINTVFSLATNALADALKGVGYAAKEVGAGLAAAYKLSESLLGNLMSTLGYTVNEVAGAIQSYFNLVEGALVNAMRLAGYAYQQVAAGVQNVYNLGKEALATVLKDAGYVLNEVADGVRQALHLLEDELSIALKSAGYAIDQIAASIQSLYNLAAQGIATALQAAGYAAEEVAGMFTNLYHLVAEEIGRLLVGAGYVASVVAEVLKNAYHWVAEQTARFFKDLLAYTAAQVIELLKSVNYALDEIAAALKSVFNLLEKGLAEVLRAAGYLASEVARLLTSLYQLAEEAIARILNEVGYALSEVVQVMKDIYNWVAGRLVQFLHDVVNAAADLAASLLKAAGFALNEIVSALNQVFRLFEEGLADVLKKAGYLAREVADAFIAVFGTIGDLAARALKAAGYLASEVVGVLKDAYHWLAGQVTQFLHDAWNYAAGVVAGLLQGANYLFDEIASSLKAVFNLIDHELAGILKSLGFFYGQVAAKLRELYNLAREGLASALKAAGYALDQVASGIKQVFNLIDRELAAVLKSAGYAFDEVASGVQIVFNLGKQALADVLRGAGYLAGQVAGKLKEFFSDASAQIAAAVLKTAGYLVEEAAAALQEVYNQAAEDVASALNYAGYAAGEIAGVLKDTFGWAAGEVANFMKDALGYGNEVINEALNAANYAVDEIGKAMSSAFGAAADAVGDFFGDVGSEVASWF